MTEAPQPEPARCECGRYLGRKSHVLGVPMWFCVLDLVAADGSTATGLTVDEVVARCQAVVWQEKK